VCICWSKTCKLFICKCFRTVTGIVSAPQLRTPTLKPLRVEPAHHNFSPLVPQKKAQLSLSFYFRGAGGIVSAPQPRTQTLNLLRIEPAQPNFSPPRSTKKSPTFVELLFLWSRRLFFYRFLKIFIHLIEYINSCNSIL